MAIIKTTIATALIITSALIAGTKEDYLAQKAKVDSLSAEVKLDTTVIRINEELKAAKKEARERSGLKEARKILTKLRKQLLKEIEEN